MAVTTEHSLTPLPTVNFKGNTITLRELEIEDYMRIAACLEMAVSNLKVDPEEIRSTPLEFKAMAKLLWKIVRAAITDYDYATKQPGPVSTMLFDELSSITGIEAAQLRKANQAEFFEILKTIWEREASGPFVEMAADSTWILSLRFLLSNLFDLLREQVTSAAVWLGGKLTGGVVSSLFPSLNPPEDGANETSGDSPSVPPLPTSAPVPSGQS